MFALIEAEKTDFAVTRMAALLEASRSVCCKWASARVAGPSPAAVRRAALDARVAVFHAASDEFDGSSRILADLRGDGQKVSRKTVAASMRRGRRQRIRPRRLTPVTTVADPAAAARPDLANRRWDAGQMDRVWTSDITFLATGQSRADLCAVRDGRARRVIGWAMADHMADLHPPPLRPRHAHTSTVRAAPPPSSRSRFRASVASLRLSQSPYHAVEGAHRQR